jgi:DNA-binding response OmpR family regulator
MVKKCQESIYLFYFFWYPVSFVKKLLRKFRLYSHFNRKRNPALDHCDYTLSEISNSDAGKLSDCGIFVFYTDNMKLLIVEDDRSLSRSINDYLKLEGHICEVALTFDDAIQKVDINKYDCIILDIGLPDGNGLDVIREMKSRKLTGGILILSARSSIDDKLTGLNIGADDYLTKPFHFAEMSARINSIYRRNNLLGLNELTFNEIRIKTDDNQVYVNDKLLVLTKKEYDLLLFFMANRNRIITKESIVEHLWGDNVILTDSFDFVYTHVKNLRKKIVAAEGKNYIKCIYGFGYKFIDT